MRTKFEGTPQGQLEEGIERVEWVNQRILSFTGKLIREY